MDYVNRGNCDFGKGLLGKIRIEIDVEAFCSEAL